MRVSVFGAGKSVYRICSRAMAWWVGLDWKIDLISGSESGYIKQQSLGHGIVEDDLDLTD